MMGDLDPEEEPSVIHGLHHVAIGVSDLDAALDFYTDAFGCELVFRSSMAADRPDADAVIGIEGVAADAVMLRLGAAHLELWQYRTPDPVDRRSPANGLGYPHIAVSVSDIESEVERRGSSRTVSCSPSSSRKAAKPGKARSPFRFSTKWSKTFRRFGS